MVERQGIAEEPTRGRRDRLTVGDRVPVGELRTVGGEVAALSGCVTHLQFRRFAGCPICHLHLRSFVTRHDQLAAAGIREIAAFHSPEPELHEYAESLPFALVADPDKRLYRKFGVESAPRALADPRAWPGIVRSVIAGIRPMTRGEQPRPERTVVGGRLGLPGDFLIGPEGNVMACRYGVHADDQWSVDEVLRLL